MAKSSKVHIRKNDNPNSDSHQQLCWSLLIFVEGLILETCEVDVKRTKRLARVNSETGSSRCCFAFDAINTKKNLPVNDRQWQ